MKAAVYARLSVKPDSDDNIDQQVLRGREVVERRGWTLVDTFVDDGVSASREDGDRPAFKRLLAAVQAGDVDAVVARHMDRLTRNYSDWGSLNAHSVKFTDWSGEVYDAFRCGIEVARANAETERMRERQLDSERRRVEAGKPPRGGHRAFGYHSGTCCPADDCDDPKLHRERQAHRPPKDKDDPDAERPRCCDGGCEHMTIREDEAPVVREMAKRYLRGEAITDLARELNEREVPTSAKKSWDHVNLRRLLLNPRHAAIRVHHGIEHPGAWDPILDEDTHRDLRDAHRAKSTRRAASTYMLGGLIACHCGSRLRGHYHNGRDNRRYFCRDCGTSILAEPVEDALWNVALARSWKRERVDKAKVREQLAEVEADLRDARKRMDALDRAYWTEGTVAKRTYDKQYPALRDKVADLKERASHLRRERTREDDRWSALRALADAYEDTPVEERRRIVRSVVDGAVLHPATTRGRVEVDRVEVTWADGEVERLVEPEGPWSPSSAEDVAAAV